MNRTEYHRIMRWAADSRFTSLSQIQAECPEAVRAAVIAFRTATLCGTGSLTDDEHTVLCKLGYLNDFSDNMMTYLRSQFVVENDSRSTSTVWEEIEPGQHSNN